jgi:AcrR family transcriptional regulator
METDHSQATAAGAPTRKSIGARRNPASQEAILDAAEAVLNEGGIAGFSIEAVAKKARAGKPTIYRWWPNRTALMLEVYRRFKHERPFPDTGSLRADLVAFLDNQLLGFWHNSLAATVYRALIAEAQTDEAAASALYAYQEGRKAVVIQIVEKAKARGECSPEVNSELIVDLVVSYAWHQLLLGRVEAALGTIEAVVDSVLYGALPRTPG